MDKKYTVNDFFCGAGGMGLGFLQAGFDVQWACDFDKHCVNTYSHNVGEWVKEADVTKLTYQDIPKADGWTFGFPCFPEGTLILTEKGYVPIEEIRIGTKVLTHTGKWQSVTDVMTKKGPTVILTGHHYGLECTPSHPIFSDEGKEIKNQDGKKTYITGVTSWTHAEDMEGKLWAVPNYLEEVEAPEMPFLWGNDEKKDKFFYNLGKWFANPASNPFDSVAIPIWCAEKFGKRAEDRSIPPWVITLPEKYRRKVLNGIISTDTTRTANGWMFVTTSKKLAESIRLLSEVNGYSSKIREGTNGNKTSYIVSGTNNPELNLDATREELHSWYKVRSVTPTKETKTVYNLTVENDNSYVADGIVVHNCQDLSVAGLQAGFVMNCNSCGCEFKITKATHKEDVCCPECKSKDFTAATRSALFFEIMRLLDETKENCPENYPSFLLAENVKGLKPYIPVLKEQLESRGFNVDIKLYNSKYFDVPQNRERYFIAATRKSLGEYSLPEEQHEYVPKLSSALDTEVDKKYYLTDEKAQKIIIQALQKLEHLGKTHSCLTPSREKKRQEGPRAKENEKEMYTLTAQDVHGVIFKDGKKTKDSTEFITQKLLEFIDKNGYIPKFFNPYNCSDIKDLAPTVTTACGVVTTSSTVLVFTDKNDGEPVMIQLPRGNNTGGVHDIAPTLTSHSYEHNNFVCESSLCSVSKICEETGLLDPNKAGKTLRVGGKDIE